MKVIREWFKAVNDGKTDKFKAEEKRCISIVVEKEKLAENGEYGLTGNGIGFWFREKKGSGRLLGWEKCAR